MTVRAERMVRDAEDALPDPHLREGRGTGASGSSRPMSGPRSVPIGATE
jgi:hypothetical protein